MALAFIAVIFGLKRLVRSADRFVAHLWLNGQPLTIEKEWLRGVRAHQVVIFEQPTEYVDSGAPRKRIGLAWLDG